MAAVAEANDLQAMDDPFVRLLEARVMLRICELGDTPDRLEAEVIAAGAEAGPLRLDPWRPRQTRWTGRDDPTQQQRGREPTTLIMTLAL